MKIPIVRLNMLKDKEIEVRRPENVCTGCGSGVYPPADRWG